MRSGHVVGRVRRAFVELHDDVRVQHLLDLHGHFGRQEQLVAVDRRCECDAILGDLAQIAERKHLKAAGVREDGFIPAHETVQAAVCADRLQPWTQPQVEGVAEDDLRVHFLELARLNRLHCAVSAHRHEDRRFDHAVIQRQATATRLAVGGE